MSDSSSDDGGGFRLTLHFPQMKAAAKPKKNRIKGAKNRLKGKKTHFPDSYLAPGQRITSQVSLNNSSDLEFTLPEQGMVLMEIPSIDWMATHSAFPLDGDDDEEDDDGNDSDASAHAAHQHHQRTAQPTHINFDRDSSDADSDEGTTPFHPEGGLHHVQLRQLKQLKQLRQWRRPSLSLDVADIPLRPPTGSGAAAAALGDAALAHDLALGRRGLVMSLTRLQMSKDHEGLKLKGILRRLALKHEDYTPGFAPTQDSDDSLVAPTNSPSQGELFMGKIFNLGSGGLSGGGMTPGATKRNSDDPPLDEEASVGDTSTSIEMKRLHPLDIDEHAKRLIIEHAPDAAVHFDDSLASNDPHDPHPLSLLLLGLPPHLGPEMLVPDSFYTENTGLAKEREVGGYDDILVDHPDDDYVPPPKKVQTGVLSLLLKLYQSPQELKLSATLALLAVTLDEDLSGFEDHLYSRHPSMDLKHAPLKTRMTAGQQASKFANKFLRKKDKAPEPEAFSSDEDPEGEKFGGGGGTDSHMPLFANARPKAPKKKIKNVKIRDKLRQSKRRQQRLRITVHIADILNRQRFIMRMCRALMLFGAPTHRLEEYMVMTLRVLEIDGQFVYIPGTMIISFGDAATRTSEVHLVKCAQGVNLLKLSDTHIIYKQVIHDLISVEEALQKLEDLLKLKNKFPAWVSVFLYGLGLLAVAPFAFGAGWVDLPICFGVGLCVGYMQYFVLLMLNLYSSVFEVTALIVVLFILRAIGTIHRHDGSHIFCFSAIAQGLLALILPGYIILCGSLELQLRNIVAGSVRMFYAIIYSLFLGFGITLGAALYGWIDKKAVSANSCDPGHNIRDEFRILFVPLFTVCLGLINQARWRQLPAMLVILCTGYVGNYFAGKHFSNVTEFTLCIGAFFIGILGNLYSRLGKGMAVSAMLPAIFVQVPGGIALNANLISGVQTADQINRKNGTDTSNSLDRALSLAFGATMVEVSIGISVGLFAAAIVVYPLGKKRTGLFSL